MERENYDVIVIGGGISGLMTASLLLKRGFNTCLVEQHYYPGGNMSGFRRNRFYFDAGSQALENVGILFPLLRELDVMGRVDMVPTDFRVIFPDVDIDLTSFETVKKALCKAFPGDTDAINWYLGIMDDLCESYKVLLKEENNPFLFSGWDRLKIMLSLTTKEFRHLRHLERYRGMPASELIAKAGIKDDRLRYIFNAAGYPDQSVICASLFWYTWLYDYYYPMGGLLRFARMLARNFAEGGGDLRLYTLVEGLDLNRRNVRSVRIRSRKDNQVATLSAKYYVSTTDYKQMFSWLPQHKAPLTKNKKATRKTQVKEAPVSECLTAVFLGLDISVDELRRHMKRHHIFTFPSYSEFDFSDKSDPHWHSGKFVEMNCPSMLDGSLAPPGKSSLTLQTFSQYDWLDNWHTNGTGERTPAYCELKDHVASELIRTAEKIIPGLSERIVVKEVATPITYHDYTYNTDGASIGWPWNPKKSFYLESVGLPKMANYETPYRNLFAAGQWTIQPASIPTAALSGRIVADRITNKL